MPVADAVVLTECGGVITGVWNEPFVDADTVVVEAGKIAAVGNHGEVEIPSDALVIDAQGQIAAPGLIDSHIHPVIGDWTPRMNTFGWLASYVQAGITTALSQGSWALGGYPEDARGMVAFGITLARAFADFRPGGMKVHGSAVSLTDDMSARDFDVLHDEGVWLIAEIGSRSIVDPALVHELLLLAHARGFTSRVHLAPKRFPAPTPSPPKWRLQWERISLRT